MNGASCIGILKPANIMIDGHGRVRITDFGLAIAASDEAQQAGDVSGTPAYMAPEQLAGRGASVRSDIYALGLVLYEVLSGKRAFTAPTIADLRDQKEQFTPTAPSEIRAGIDPVVERLVMRCMDRDPRARPASLVQLATALPGGDPLAAAIAAGETPSPELVAASGSKEGLRPGVAVMLLVFIAIGATFLVAMNPKTAWIDQIRLERTPEALVDRARELVKKIGYAPAPADRAHGFQYDPSFLRYVEADKKTRRADLEAFLPAFFWYRESPRPLQRLSLNFREFGGFFTSVTTQDPPLGWPGEIRLRLDGSGRLWSLEVIPPEQDPTPLAPITPDWAVLFAEASLEMSTWQPSTPQWNPNTYADTRAAWQGSFPERPDVPLRVEAAAYRGKPVSFSIVGPWTQSLRSSVSGITTAQTIGGILSTLVLAALIGGGLFFASRNLRIGRGDRRGAWRLATVTLALSGAVWLLVEHHVAGFGELSLFFSFASWALSGSGFMWVMYVALEPFVRRRWPYMLVSWTRVLSGAWRDPLVGRDVLIGCAAGVASRVGVHLILLASSDLELPVGLEPILGTPFFLAGLLEGARSAINSGLAILFLFFFLRAVIRIQWLAVVTALLLTSLAIALPVPGYSPWVDAVIGLILVSVFLWVLVSFGLVALIVSVFTSFLFVSYPMTFRSTWYASYGYAALAVVAAIALYGFRTALGERPILRAPELSD
jgi:protein kinase-like protein